MDMRDQESDLLDQTVLKLALIGPHDQRRRTVASALASSHAAVVREYSTYPPSLKDVPRLLEQGFDAVIIDMESDPEYALSLVEEIAGTGQATVIVYAARVDPNWIVRAMRAGAREFLSDPIDQNALTEALARVGTRRTTPRPQQKTGGKLLVFLGGKGGSGVTTVACNFAVALVQDCGQSAVLIDLDLPLGDAALSLGLSPQFSTADALQSADRLDSNFFQKLLVKHSSGLPVLGAPGRFPHVQAHNEAIDKLLAVAKQEFDWVVVDAGSRFDLTGASWFQRADTVYMVMQAGIPELRNSHRLVSEFFKTGVPKLEIVLNRYVSRSMGVDEEHIEKALTRPIQWRIPSDYFTVRRMQNEAVPITSEDSAISKSIQDMARAACGMEPKPEKKKGFSLFSK
ncbi:MAG TPA: AAA family ATPase [Terracidiphilus sp.]